MKSLILLTIGFGVASTGTVRLMSHRLPMQTGKAQAGNPQPGETPNTRLQADRTRANTSQAGQTQVGRTREGQFLLPTYQRLHPAGASLAFGGRPVDLALSPDGRTLFIKESRGLVIVDAITWKRRQELPFPQGGSSMHGLVVTRDGKHVYATTAQNRCYKATVAPDSTCAWTRTLVLPGPGGKGDSHPCGIALAPDGKHAYICLSRNNTLGVVDLETGMLQAEIPVGVAPWDVALSPEGKTAYVSNWGGRHPRPGEQSAPSSGTSTLVDARGIANSGTVSFIDLAAGREIAQAETGLHPSDVELDANGRQLFVANANSDTVSVLDCATRHIVETISVHPDLKLPFGSAPTGLALSADGRRLFVTLGGNNAIAVIALEESLPPANGVPQVPPARTEPRPQDNSKQSQKEVPTGRSRLLGFIPTGWYPGAVVARDSNLFVVNVKGDGTPNKPPNASGGNTLQHLGTVARIALPSVEELHKLSERVRADLRAPEIRRDQKFGRKRPLPIPPSDSYAASAFTHVVYIIKENRTYDQVFGDLTQGNGAPKLCLFGREVTPNQHALAEQFVLLDNFYCNGVLSADGHSWATEGNVTDHLEKSFGGFTRSYTFGDDPLTYSSSGFVWDGAIETGLRFRNYGEMDYAKTVPANASFAAVYKDYVEHTGHITFTQSIGLETMRSHSCPSYPGWNLNIPDVLRAARFLAELKQAEDYKSRGGQQTGSPQNPQKPKPPSSLPEIWPNLMVVYLPQDHTSGASPGAPTPRAMVADNDLALGRIVEGISHSRFWPETCIFVIEDDPQDGFDHVDGHRSTCLVISPYTKRKAVIHQFYNQTSVLHTIEEMLGLPTRNQFDALSPLMNACFNARPNLRPFQSLPNSIALNEMNPPLSALQGRARMWAQKSLAMNFRQPDNADEDTLNRIVWHATRGVNAPYPARLTGGHGRGLRKLGLKLNPALSGRKTGRTTAKDDD